jgi:hypothetical protein
MLTLVDVDLGYSQQIILPKVNLSFKANEHVAISKRVCVHKHKDWLITCRYIIMCLLAG